MPRMNIKIEELRAAGADGNLLNAKLDEIMANCSPDDPPYLSDCLAAYNKGGSHIMQELGRRYDTDRNVPLEQRFRWKLLVMRDEWGNVPQPGDTIIRRIQKPLEIEPGKPLSSREIDMDKLNGDFDRKWVIKVPYTVDEKGCIEVEFQDCSYFLQQFGRHGKSNAVLARHRKEHSEEPSKSPTGEMRHVWYHRYKEMDKEDYAALPLRTKDVKKPGRPKKADV